MTPAARRARNRRGRQRQRAIGAPSATPTCAPSSGRGGTAAMSAISRFSRLCAKYPFIAFLGGRDPIGELAPPPGGSPRYSPRTRRLYRRYFQRRQKLLQEFRGAPLHSLASNDKRALLALIMILRATGGIGKFVKPERGNIRTVWAEPHPGLYDNGPDAWTNGLEKSSPEWKAVDALGHWKDTLKKFEDIESTIGMAFDGARPKGTVVVAGKRRSRYPDWQEVRGFVSSGLDTCIEELEERVAVTQKRFGPGNLRRPEFILGGACVCLLVDSGWTETKAVAAVATFTHTWMPPCSLCDTKKQDEACRGPAEDANRATSERLRFRDTAALRQRNVDRLHTLREVIRRVYRSVE